MHSENKERDDSVMPTSSTLLQITEKGVYLVHLQYCRGFGVWLVGFFVCVCLFLKYLFFFIYIYIQNKAGNGCLKPAPPWKEDRIRTGKDTHTPEGRAETFGIKSLENHVTNMTFLESK